MPCNRNPHTHKVMHAYELVDERAEQANDERQLRALAASGDGDAIRMLKERLKRRGVL